MKIANLISTLLSQVNGPANSEVSGTWTVCIPCEGDVQRYATTSLIQAESTLNEWLSAGWPAWIEDNTGNIIHSIQQSSLMLN